MAEYLAQLPLLPRFVTHHGHMADGALVFDGARRLRMVDRFAANTGLPIRITRGIRHDARAPIRPDRNVLPGRRDQPYVTREAAVGSLKSIRLMSGVATRFCGEPRTGDQQNGPTTGFH